MAEQNPSQIRVDRASCPSPHSSANKLARLIWQVAWALCFRPVPWFWHAPRRLLLRLFGARVTGYSGTGMTGAVPAMNSIDMQTLLVGRTMNTTVTALDADGDDITFACTSEVQPAQWSLNANSGAFTFTPDSEGMAQFDFTATDKDGTSAAMPFSVQVNVLPAMSFNPPANGITVSSATINSQTGMTYSLEYTTSLTDNPRIWIPVDSEAGTGDAITLQDATVGTQRFYRIVIY